MRQIQLSFLFLLIAVSQLVSAETAKIHWLHNYDQAVQQAEDQSKPMLLFFTGSKWCGWCKKLEDEVFNTPEFAHLAGNAFIFVELDFPQNATSLPDSDQKKQLQKKFHVRGFPTVVLLNSHQKQIGITGYRDGGGRSYANHLLNIMRDYKGYKEKLSTLNHQKLSDAELKTLYEKAQEFHCSDDIAMIVQQGMESDDSRFFMLEKLRSLSSEDKLDSTEAITIKQQLLQTDPHNAHYTQYHLAVIEFESRYKEMRQNKRSPKSTVAPLIAYTEAFGAQDKENIWRLNMIISQVLYDKKEYREALVYAQRSYESAPRDFQEDIAEVISDITSRMRQQD